MFIEPNDGSHVFGIQLGTYFPSAPNVVEALKFGLGSPFTDPTGSLPAEFAHDFKVLDHDLNILFKTPFDGSLWHNFAIEVDWNELTLAVFYSQGSDRLKLVAPAVANPGAAAGSVGQGVFHFGVLKV